MALSKRTKEVLEVAMADRRAAKEVSDALGAAAGPAGHIADISSSNLPASAAALSTSDTYSDAAVNAEIDAQVNALAAAAETRLDAIEAKINAILAALQAADLMA